MSPRCDQKRYDSQGKPIWRCKNRSCIRLDPMLGFNHIEFFCRVHAPPNYLYGIHKKKFWLKQEVLA